SVRRPAKPIREIRQCGELAGCATILADHEELLVMRDDEVTVRHPAAIDSQHVAYPSRRTTQSGQHPKRLLSFRTRERANEKLGLVRRNVVKCDVSKLGRDRNRISAIRGHLSDDEAAIHILLDEKS